MKKRLVVLLFCALFLSRNASAEEELQAVLEYLETGAAQVTSVATDVVQTKKMAMFAEPLTIKGKMFLEKPGRFAWHQQEPIRYSLVVQDNIIQQWDEDTGRVQRFSAADNPAVSVALKQMTQWFYGEYTGLLKDYRATIIRQDPLKLQFIPRRDTSLFKLVANVEVVFRKDGRYIESLYIEEHDGDTTRFEFTNTEINTDIAPDAWKVKADAE